MPTSTPSPRTSSASSSGTGRQAGGVCPSRATRTPRSSACSTNRWKKAEDGTWGLSSGCGFEMWKTAFGKKLTKAQAKALLERGRTGLVKGLKGKSGKEFEAYLALDGRDGKVSVEFPPKKPKRG